MPLPKRFVVGPWPLVAVMLSVAMIVLACRFVGFGDGVTLSATPASAVALAAALLIRWRGALAAAAGFALAGLLWRLGPGDIATDAVSHGLAAFLAALAMRNLARRRRVETKTNEWLIFLVGVCVFTTTVAAGMLAGAATGLLGPPPDPWLAPLLAAVFEPLGLFTFFVVIASLDEYRRIRSNLRPATDILVLALFLLAVLGLLLAVAPGHVSPSGVTLILSVPFCLWIAMQRRSLDGAAISFVAAHVALLLVLNETGSIDRLDYVTTIIYLNLLVATCQLVHAVNLDRLGALATIEAHKRDLEARVAERTARLNAMTERALAADAAKTRFLATVSHEVRTPLNGVIGMASVVLAADLDPRTRRNVEVIHGSGLYLLDVINRILDFSKIDSGWDPDDTVAFDLRALVEEVLEEARFLPSAEGLDLRAEIDATLVSTRCGYRHGLRQVLTNLVGNAAKFTDRGSVIVRARGRRNDWVRIEVKDSGIGIPADACERIFLPFEQANDSTTRRYGGTGLGLAICAEIVKRIGGRIGVESVEGAGSLFWIELALPVSGAPATPKLEIHVGG